MPRTTFTSFPLNLSILLQNENNDWQFVAEGKTLPQKAIEEWIAENATDLDREADAIFRELETSSLPESERWALCSEVEQKLEELDGSALALRHLAVINLDRHYGRRAELAAIYASEAVELGCDPARYQLLQGLTRIFSRVPDEELHAACRESLHRDECALLLAGHLQSLMLDRSGVMDELFEALLRQAREGSTDALRLLFLAMASGALENDDAAGEVHALLCERAKTNIFCARLLAQYRLGLIKVLHDGIFGDDDAPGSACPDTWMEIQEDMANAEDMTPGRARAALFKLMEPMSHIFDHALRLPDGWAEKRAHFVHAASLGDPWSELVLHVYDAMWEDCPHDAMALLRELADTKNYPPAQTLLGALRYNHHLAEERSLAKNTEKNGKNNEIQHDDPSLDTERGRCGLAELLKQAALAMPENPALERIWLDFELYSSFSWAVEHPDEKPHYSWELTEDEWEAYDPDDLDDPLRYRADPQMSFVRNHGTVEEPIEIAHVDLMAGIVTANPHLAAIRDRAAEGGPYAAFLLARSILGGGFGPTLGGYNSPLLIEACLNFAMLHGVEQAVVFFWAYTVGRMGRDYDIQDLEDITLALHYHAARYRSFSRLFILMENHGLQKWFLEFLSGKPQAFDDMAREAKLFDLLMSTPLCHELMGIFLLGAKFYETAHLVHLAAMAELASLGHDMSEERDRELFDQPNALHEGVFFCFCDSINVALPSCDLPTLYLVAAALHHASRAKLDRSTTEDLQGLFSPLARNNNLHAPLHTTLDHIATLLWGWGMDMNTIREYFEHFEDPEEERRRRRAARKKRRQRARKRKR